MAEKFTRLETPEGVMPNKGITQPKEKPLEMQIDIMEVTLAMKGKVYNIAVPIEQHMGMEEYDEFFETVKQAMIKMVKKEFFNFTTGGKPNDPWKDKRGEGLCLKDLNSIKELK